MKLFMTTDAVGGVWRYSVDIATALAVHGVQTTLAVLGPEPTPEQRAEAAHFNLHVTGLPLDWTAPDRQALAAAAHRLTQLAQRHDAIQLNQPALAGLARWPAPTLAFAHSCVGTWWRAVHGNSPLPPGLAAQADLTAKGLRAAQATAAPTAAFAANLARTYALPRAPTPIHNGRAIAPLPRGERGWGEGEGAILFAGRLWDPAKNAALLDRIAPHVPGPVHLFGQTTAPHGGTFTPSHATAHGSVSADTLAVHLARRPIFAAPALYEPFGLAILEAAQAGCPLVLADIPSLRELWDGAALFADPRDDAAWITALTTLDRDALGAAAQTRAAGYTVEASAARLHALLTTLAPAQARAA